MQYFAKASQLILSNQLIVVKLKSDLKCRGHICFHSHKKRKDSLETRAVLLIFVLEFEISGVAVQSIHQNSENDNFCSEMLSKNDFEAVLVTFCCYNHGAKASE